MQQNYMYTPFEGTTLLNTYKFSRMLVINRQSMNSLIGQSPDRALLNSAVVLLNQLHNHRSLDNGTKFNFFLKKFNREEIGAEFCEDSLLRELVSPLQFARITEPITTLELLHAIISAQLQANFIPETRFWIDKLVQRYEVTKKLYESYPPGFRSGNGKADSIRMYWLLALSLSLHFTRTNELKYLSTLLKVGDLLCSVPEGQLVDDIPRFGIEAVLGTELIGTEMLAKHKGVEIALS